MDIHPWTKYEIARIRDEERLLRARAAMRAGELREPDLGNAETGAATGSLFDRLFKRGGPVADQPSVGARSA